MSTRSFNLWLNLLLNTDKLVKGFRGTSKVALIMGHCCRLMLFWVCKFLIMGHCCSLMLFWVCKFFCEADWALMLITITIRPTSGSCIFFGHNLVSWFRKQNDVAPPSADAYFTSWPSPVEFMDPVSAFWVRNWVPYSYSLVWYNQSAVSESQ